MLALRVAWRDLCFRPVLTAVTLALLGLAVAQATVVVLLARAFEAGLVRASRPFDLDRKSTRLNSSHIQKSRMPSSA